MSDKTVISRQKVGRPRYYFREWRKHRNLTQEALASRVGMSTPSISQIETGKQGFTDTTLEALADALQCQPGDLLMRNPSDPQAPWSLWESLTPEQRVTGINLLKALKGTGTDG